MRSSPYCLTICWFATVVLAASAAVHAQDVDDTPADDTAAILELSKIGAQLQLNEQRIIGVTLIGEDIDDKALELLAGLQRLQTLTLRDTQVSGDGLKHLQDLTLLGALTIHNSPVSDRDIDELASLKSVVNYDLRGTKISGMGKQRLDRLLKMAGRDAYVRLHFGGFFGVAGTFDAENCLLTNVVADSAAGKAGLRVGDVITKFDGQAIENFPELAAQVALTPPEQPVEVEVSRGGMKMTFTVELTRAPGP